MKRTADDRSSRVTFIGALPPPVTGMTAMSQVIVEALRDAGRMRCFNWSPGKHLSGLRWKVARITAACRSFVKVLFGRRSRGELLYYPISSAWGLLYDIAILGAARVRGYKIAVHHHVYWYIDRYDWRMALLNRVLGPRVVHVVHCEQMKKDFLASYRTPAEFLFVPGTIVSKSADAAPLSGGEHSRFTLGFLSNLTLAKGLDSALATYTQLVGAGRNAAMILAGPCHRPRERRMLDAFLAQWPRGVEYRGPIYGAAKGRFFADIDVLLFPTRSESWGIVLNEALSASCPVITCRRGCVPWIVQDGCGIVVDDPNDFAREACQVIQKWMDDAEEFQRVRRQAGERARVLAAEADRQFADFLRRMREL